MKSDFAQIITKNYKIDIAALEEAASKSQDIEENISYKSKERQRFDAQVLDIAGAFYKLNKINESRGETIFDVKKYEKELKKILSEVSEDLENRNMRLFSEIGAPGVDDTMEGMIYSKHAKTIENFSNKINLELLPLYTIYLRTKDIQDGLKTVSVDSIDKATSDTIVLIKELNGLNLQTINEDNTLVNEAYDAIYSVLLYENMFGIKSVLQYLQTFGQKINIERIGRLLSKDLKYLDSSILTKLELKNVNREGIGYDYLDEEVISTISTNTVGEKNSDYQVRKQRTIDELWDSANKIKEEKEKIVTSMDTNNKELKRLIRRKRIITSKMMSLVLIPIVSITAGYAVGKSASDKIIEYKTITRTVDAKTGRVIGEVSEVYDDKETTYVATVLVNDPWKRNLGGGYVRNVIAYEYVTPENAGSDFHASDYDINNSNLVEKYRYLEAKDELTAGDSTTEQTIIITETYQDKTSGRKSNRYTLSVPVFAGFGALLFDLAVLMIEELGYNEAKRRLNKVCEEIDKGKITKEVLEQMVTNLQNRAQLLKKEHEEAVKKYGDLGNQFIFEDIPTFDEFSFGLKPNNRK